MARALAGASFAWVGGPAQAGDASGRDPVRVAERLRDIERRAQGRLGVHVVDTATGASFGHRADERFMLLSSFKLLASAYVLHRVDVGRESLDRHIAFSRTDLVEWSPVTGRHAGSSVGLTIADLCEAAIATSDNTAANLILSSFGGPRALTRYLRALGDEATRLDRIEPSLNVPASSRVPLDTTTPRAMAATTRRLVLGDALSAVSRARLRQWLLASETGGRRIKAGMPADWRVGDKTGTNATDANDVAVAWPPKRAPLVVAAYLADSAAPADVKEATLAAAGALAREFAA